MGNPADVLEEQKKVDSQQKSRSRKIAINDTLIISMEVKGLLMQSTKRSNNVLQSLLLGIMSLLAVGMLAACGGYDPNTAQSSSAVAAPQTTAQGGSGGNKSISFPVVPAAAAIQKCLPHARGEATILPDELNDTMKFQVYNLAPKQKYTLFVLQLPNKPFGVSWYQGAIFTDGDGNGSVIVRGIF